MGVGGLVAHWGGFLGSLQMVGEIFPETSRVLKCHLWVLLPNLLFPF